MSQNDTNFYQNNQRTQSIKILTKNNSQMIINAYPNDLANRSFANSNMPICNQQNELCCVLCGLGESNMLSLGKLHKFNSTIHFNSNNFINLKNFLLNSTLNESNNSKITTHNYKSSKLKVSMLLKLGVKAIPQILLNDISKIGWTMDPNIKNTDIFDMINDCFCVHLNCFVWSVDIQFDSNNHPINIDKIVYESLTKKCSLCDLYGASVKCLVPECTQIFHYSCSVLAGSYQNLLTHRILCPDHINQSSLYFDTKCLLCDSSDRITEQLFCTNCGYCYHSKCLSPQIEINPLIRIGWQCPECKICQSCQKRECDTKIVVCENCDKCYHSYCLKNEIFMLKSSPGWKCDPCKREMSLTRACLSCKGLVFKDSIECLCETCQEIKRNLNQENNKKRSVKDLLQLSRSQTNISQNLLKKEPSNDFNANMTVKFEMPAQMASKPISSATSKPSIATKKKQIPKKNQNKIAKRSGQGSTSQVSISTRGTRSRNNGKDPKTDQNKRVDEDFDFQKKKNSGNDEGSIGTIKRDEDDHHAVTVISSINDSFNLKQDMCLSCGSFGKGESGVVLPCSQCGQCFHSFCAGVNGLSDIMLQKGWRCLDCTVCEGCGKATDESRLLLCDDCDISYHIYCLDPPLDQVPQGNWKCKWCAKCIKCGSRSPGKDLEWKNNYTECALCYSLNCCHICESKYNDSDIVGKCLKCERWSHVNCKLPVTEEDAEKKYGQNFKCSKCCDLDKSDRKLNSKFPNSIENNQNEPLLFMEEIINMSKRCQIDEGTFLTDLGAELIKRIKIKPLPCPRRRPPKTNTLNTEFDANKILDENSQSSTDDKPDSIHEELNGDVEHGNLAQSEIKKQIAPPKRQINFGLGGFYVKSRRIKPQLSQPDGMETNENDNKVNQKRKKKFTYEDMIPSYMQEAFFGINTLNTCQDAENNFDEPFEKFAEKTQKVEVHKVNLDENLFKLAQQNKKESLELGIEDFLDGDIVSYLFNENRNLIEFNPEHDLGQKNRSNDEKIFDEKIYEDLLHQIVSSEPGQKTNTVDEYLNLNHSSEAYEHKECSETMNDNRNIDDLARQFKESTHKYASNQAHSSMSNIEMYSNHSEFLNIQDPLIHKVSNFMPDQVIRPAQIEQAKINPNQYNFIMNHKLEQNQAPNTQNIVFQNAKYPNYTGENISYQQQQQPQVQENRNFNLHQQPQVQESRNFNSHQQPIQLQTQVLPSPQPKPSETTIESQISYDEQESSNDCFNSSGSKTNQNSQTKETKEDLSKHQKMLEKYAEDEDLGEMATQAMPLYSNVNFPNLKNEIKDVQERYRYVNKIWRKLDSQVKQDYINKSRQNRYKKKSDEKVANKAKARVKSPLNSDAENLQSRSATPSISMEDTNENSQASHMHTASINQLGHGQILLCQVPNQQLSQNPNQIKQMDQIIHHHLQQQQLQQQQQQMSNKQEKITIKSYLSNQMNANMTSNSMIANQQHFSNQYQFSAPVVNQSHSQERNDQNEAKKNDTVSDHIDSIIDQVVAGSGTIPYEIDWDDEETNSSFKEFILSQTENQSNSSNDRPAKSKKKTTKSSEDISQSKSAKSKKRQKNDSEIASLQQNQTQPVVNQMNQFGQQNSQIIDPSKLNINMNQRTIITNSATKINEILMINSQNQPQNIAQNFHQLNSNSNVFLIPTSNQLNIQDSQSINLNHIPCNDDNLKKILSIPGNELVIEAPMQNQSYNVQDFKKNIMVRNILVSPSEQQMSQQQTQQNSMQTISQSSNLKLMQLDGQIDEFEQPKGQPQMSVGSHMVNSADNSQGFHKQDTHLNSKLSSKVVINHELLSSYGITYNPNTQSTTYSQSTPAQDTQNFAMMNQSYVNKSDNTLLKQLLNTAPKNAVTEQKAEIKTENIPPSIQMAISEKSKKPKSEKPRSQKPKQQNKLLSDLKNKIESNIQEEENPRKRKNIKANQDINNETLMNKILDELKSFGLLSMSQPEIDHSDEIYQNLNLPEKDHFLKFRQYNLKHLGELYNLKVNIESLEYKENILEEIENKLTVYNKKSVQQSVKICSANLPRPPNLDTNRELLADSSNRLERLLESESSNEKMFDEDSNMTDYSGQILFKQPSSPRIDLQLNQIKKESVEMAQNGRTVKTTFKLSHKAGLNFKETVEKMSEILNIDMPSVLDLGKIVKHETKMNENLKTNTNNETLYTMQSLANIKFNTCSFCECFLNEEKENVDNKILFCSKYCRVSFKKLLNLKQFKSQNQDISSPTVPIKSEFVVKKEKRLLKWSRDLVKNFIRNDSITDSDKFELLKTNGHDDNRMCVFCKQKGDLEQNGPCRLLSLDVDKWSHLNCALWSDEVYETMNGALINVEIAFKKSQNLQCCYCHEKGASLRCFSPKCNCFYHFPCAVKDKCAFNQDKTIYCSTHSCKALNENRLVDLSVKRSVWIQRDEVAQIQSFMIRDFDENAYAIRIGSLTLHNIGQLLPHQLSTGSYNTRDYIYPVGYKATRIYWSTKNCLKRCQYLCSIEEVDGKPEFSVTIIEDTGDREVIVDKSPSDIWKRILEKVEIMRKNFDLVKLFPSYFSGEYMYGLTEPHIIRLVESLPGVETLTNYAFKFGKLQLLDMPLAINPTGCARSEPKLRTHFRKSRTLTCPTMVPNPVQRSESNASSNGLNSNGLNQNQINDNLYEKIQDLSDDDEFVKFTADSDSNGSIAYSKQFVQSKSSQFRKLKAEWRQNVYLAKSKIQGLGLYAARDLEKNTMIIEYIGELIRNEVANRREKLYESQNRGIYMFRLNDELVVDATISGGLARYINHCCDPNCVAETVTVEKDQKIIIIANKKILKGEELTYDYQFEFEDESSKIQCLCGSANCKKWMN